MWQPGLNLNTTEDSQDDDSVRHSPTEVYRFDWPTN
jgi:hypothetical protein